MTFQGNCDHQLELEIGGSPGPALVQVSRAQNKKRPVVRLPVVELPSVESGFVAKEGTPKNRRHCRTDGSYCQFLRCEWHLARIDGGSRPGRPGLSSVPRDAQGRTLPVKGDAGKQRAPTTAHPGWLELERTCKVVLLKNEDRTDIIGVEPHDRGRNDRWTWRGKPVGSLDLFLRTLQEDETIDVYNDCDKHVARAALTSRGLRFSCVPDAIVVTLVRERPVESCGLDLIERHGKMTNQQIGAVLEDGKYRTTVARIVKAGGRKLREAGVDLRDLLGDDV